MGLLDRFKKEPGPDALTFEAVARARAVPGVAQAEAIDADTVHVTWAGHEAPTALSLAEVRPAWTKASGFDRIELMDDLVIGLAPPAAVAPTPDPAVSSPDPAPTDPAPTHPAPTDPATIGPAGDTADTSAWEAARTRLRVVIGRPGEHPDAISWPVGAVLEARAVLGGPGALPVDQQDCAQWGVDAAAVQAASLANLAATDPGLDPVGPGQPAWVPTEPADHPPAWLAAPDRLLAACGLRAAVVLAPLPTELVVVDPDAHELLGSILTSTQTIVTSGSQLLWPAPFLVTPGGVAPWEPEPDHPCAPAVAALGRQA